MRPDHELGTISAAFCPYSSLLGLWGAKTGAWVYLTLAKSPPLRTSREVDDVGTNWACGLMSFVGGHAATFKAHGIDGPLSSESKQVARLCIEESHIFLKWPAC